MHQRAHQANNQPGRPAAARRQPFFARRRQLDWVHGKGDKGKWESAGEQTLNGTWGKGTARSGGGDWNLKKV